MPISWNTVIFKFRRNKPSIWCFVEAGSPLIRLSFVATGQWASLWTDFTDTILRSLVAKIIQAKFENDCIPRSGDRFKITQPNLMILASFPLRKMRYLMMSKNMKLLARMVLKICCSAFWDTRYIYFFKYWVSFFAVKLLPLNVSSTNVLYFKAKI